MNGPAQRRARAEALASRLPSVLVGAHRVAATVAFGLHGRRRSGPGEAFWQFRPYESGDPAAAIDWRRSAKGESLFVREREWANAQTVWLWRDRSPSMAYASRRDLPDKREACELMLLALAILLARAGERFGLIGERLRILQGLGGTETLAAALAAEEAAGDGAPMPAAPPRARHSRAVLFGDFLAPLDEVEDAVRRFTTAGVTGHLVQVLDPAETALPFAGRTRFAGLEAEADLLVRRAERMREAYRDRLEAHRAGLTAIARAVGWTFQHHRTDQPAEPPLLALARVLAEPPEA